MYARHRSVTAVRSDSESANAEWRAAVTNSAEHSVTNNSFGNTPLTASLQATTIQPVAIASPIVLSKLPEGVRFKYIECALYILGVFSLDTAGWNVTCFREIKPAFNRLAKSPCPGVVSP